MPRPSRIDEQRKELLPIVARTFAELGYRRATTAELSRRCGVKENILYRLWKDKKAMFIASLDAIYELALEKWTALAEVSDPERSVAERTLDYEAEHLGEAGLHRLVFAGLNETDDLDIRRAMARLYRSFHRFVRREIQAHDRLRGREEARDPGRRAWTIIGLATFANISRELDLLGDRARRDLIATEGRQILDGQGGS